MKVGRVLTMKEIENLSIPDEFSIEMKGDDSNSELIYIEYYRDADENHFREIAGETKRDILSIKENVEIDITYREGTGIITIKQKGSRAELLSALFQEILLQLGFYYENDEIREFFDYVKVYEYWEEK
jgi:predicted transcriptional regulator